MVTQDSKMSTPINAIRDSYDAAAAAYAEHLGRELEQKPLDRHLLNRFAEAMRGQGMVADIGCGPGHLAAYLHEQGVSVFGLDLSPEMIRVARSRNRDIKFREGDMAALAFDDASLAGIVAFYSIVHFESAALRPIFREMRRVIAPRGLALIAFHAGEDVIHRDELFGAPVSLDFRFHRPSDVIRTLHDTGWQVIEQTEREPYPGPEFPSRRCYLLATIHE